MSSTAPIPEYLPGEPPPLAWGPVSIVRELAGKLFFLAAVVALNLPLWPVYLVARLRWPRPPNVTPLSRCLRCLRWIVTERPPPPAPSVVARIALALSVLQHMAAAPLRGLAWFLDELLYGRALGDVELRAPLFEISAARSGSTQLARHLEDDPRICAPNFLQSFLPYLWLWKLAARVPARLITREEVRRSVLSRFPPAFLQRHEMDPFCTDTFEMIFLRSHLGHLMMAMGPRSLLEDAAPNHLLPHNRSFWEEDFTNYLDRVGRKALLFAGGGPNDAPRRLMVKGHFLAVAPILARRYPDARFLAVLRAPDRRLQSVINFWRCHETEALCGPPPWSWLVQHALRVEPDYCALEMEWFQKEPGPRRCVVRFDDFVQDLPGTLRKVYRECLDLDEPPPQVQKTHAARVRGHYSIDRSLEQLGVDVASLNESLEAYRRWCRGA